MDRNRFEEARQAYDSGDYRTAAKMFLASAGRGTDGNGAAYHMAGNSLLRLRRYQDAVTVYTHALRDEIYDAHGAVQANLGAAYFALGDYVEAVHAYEAALKEAEYSTPYKALQGMASALLERGRVEEAAAAYRRAALDPANPDPGKALVNLGLCFMGLGRPADAVEAYQAALGFDGYKGRGKALANLGQAYFALGEYQEAVKAFEKATQLHSHGLSQAAGAAYEEALRRVQSEAVGAAPAAEDTVPAIVAQSEGESEPETGLGAIAEGGSATSPQGDAESAARVLGFGDEAAVADFFSVTDDELRDRDRVARRANRSQGGARTGKVLVTVLITAVLVCGVAAAGWFMGYGWPTQQQAVSGMLSAYGEGKPVASYWVAVPDSDVTKEMAKMPVPKAYTVDGVTRGRQTSLVTVTLTPKTGSALRFSVTLVREGVGWKVSGIDNDWQSTGVTAD